MAEDREDPALVLRKRVRFRHSGLPLESADIVDFTIHQAGYVNQSSSKNHRAGRCATERSQLNFVAASTII